MSYKGQLVIDMDSHIRQYWDLDRTYKEHIDPEYRDTYQRFSQAAQALKRRAGDRGFSEFLWPALPRRPLGVYDAYEVQGDGGARADEAISGDRAATHAGVRIDPACNWDPAIRLRDMDVASVDISVIFPSSADSFCALRDVGFESALHEAFHRFMSGYCAEAGGRLWWVGAATMRDIPKTIAQLEYWTKRDRHFAGLQIPRACPDGSMLDNPDLHPLYAASQELDMPLWVHGGANRPPFTPWVDAPNGLYHSIGGQYALAALVGGGVFDLFPKLRIGLFESFGGWMPYVVEKLDEGYKPGSPHTPKQKRTASEIVEGGNLFCSVEAGEKHIPYAIEALGDHLWLFSTDYPHHGSAWPNAVPLIWEKPLSERAKIKLLAENALRFLPGLRRAAQEASARR
ncbi:MAG TPA: amidohydrolase family protein [Candidatus Acidoferrales bacterium]|nr:amidohydrolase family protein [Candidatus Acidoferrales bacterium]